MKTINIQTARTAELLSFYNSHADKPVSKFTNLETARRRVTALIALIKPVAAKKVPGERRSNAEGIAKSWLVPAVRAARLYRQGVFVTVGKATQEFRSTRAAFDALGLPVEKSIRFRMELKAAKKLSFKFEGKSYSFQTD